MGCSRKIVSDGKVATSAAKETPTCETERSYEHATVKIDSVSNSNQNKNNFSRSGCGDNLVLPRDKN